MTSTDEYSSISFPGTCTKQFKRGPNRGLYCGEDIVPGTSFCHKCNRNRTPKPSIRRDHSTIPIEGNCKYQYKRGYNRGLYCNAEAEVGTNLCRLCSSIAERSLTRSSIPIEGSCTNQYKRGSYKGLYCNGEVKLGTNLCRRCTSIPKRSTINPEPYVVGDDMFSDRKTGTRQDKSSNFHIVGKVDN